VLQQPSLNQPVNGESEHVCNSVPSTLNDGSIIINNPILRKENRKP